MIQESEAFLIIRNNKSIDEEWASIRPKRLMKFADQLYTYDFWWETFMWNHICLIFYTNSSLRLVVNMQEVNVTRLDHINSNISENVFVNSILLGVNTYGQFRDLHIWSRRLNQFEMAEYQNCGKNLREGEIFSWDSWQTNQQQRRGHLVRRNTNPCSKKYEMFVDLVNQKKMTLAEATKFCNKMGGEVYVPSSEKELKDVLDGIKTSSYDREFCGFRAYVGLRKSGQTGALYEPTKGENWTSAAWWSDLWHHLAPNGGDHQTCVALNLTHRYLDDVSCDTPLCSLCQYKSRSVFSTRGFCEKENPRNWQFKMSNLPGPRYNFIGFGTTVLTFDNQAKTFNISDVFSKKTLAWQKLPTGYPFGKSTWQLEQSLCMDVPGPHVLDISRCSESEFQCSDGSHCIHLEKKCNAHCAKVHSESGG